MNDGGARQALVAAALLATGCATAPAPVLICDGQIRTVYTQVGSKTEYSLQNDCYVPVTIELSFPVFRNVRADRDLPVREVALAHSTTRLVALEPVNVAEGWEVRPLLAYLWFGSAQPVPDPSALYEFPFGGSESRILIQGEDGAFTHQGIHRYAYDFDVPIGTPVLAARAGVVLLVVDGFDEGGVAEKYKGRANTVFVLQGDGTLALYTHLTKGIAIAPGTHVSPGDFLGSSGNTGYSRGPHLHFEVNIQSQDPESQQSVPVHFRATQRLEEGHRYGPFEQAHQVITP